MEQSLETAKIDPASLGNELRLEPINPAIPISKIMLSVKKSWKTQRERMALLKKIEGYKEEYDDLKDAVDTITGKPLKSISKNNIKKKMEGWENVLKRKQGHRSRTNKIKVYDAGKTILIDAAGYQAAGNSRNALALTKATTQYLVDTGLNTILDKNPVMKTVNTCSTMYLLKKELTAGRS